MSGLDFVAVDFETANGSRASVCQVGLTRVAGGEVVAEDAWYVIPPTGVENFNVRNVLIHHITPEFVARHGIDWEASLARFEGFAAGQVLVAHNAGFDHSVFERSTRHLALAVPPHRWEDTLALSRRTLDLPNHKLDTVARHLGIAEFAHHDACADARACALIATVIAQRTGARSVDDLWPGSASRSRWGAEVDPAWSRRSR
jgi:DNA polymerase-3 subunit epsilon